MYQDEQSRAIKGFVQEAQGEPGCERVRGGPSPKPKQPFEQSLTKPIGKAVVTV